MGYNDLHLRVQFTLSNTARFLCLLALAAAGKTVYALNRARNTARGLQATRRVVVSTHLQVRAWRRGLDLQNRARPQGWQLIRVPRPRPGSLSGRELIHRLTWRTDAT